MGLSIFLFFSIVLVLILLVISTTIKLEIKELEISNLSDGKINSKYLINVKLYLFSIIKYFQINIDKDKVINSKLWGKLKNADIKKVGSNFKNTNYILKILRPRIEKLDVELKIGSELIFVTTALVVIISIGSSYIFSKTVNKLNHNRYNYKVQPIYENKNLIDLHLDCIIKVKMVHIINIIYIVLKKRRDLKDERASNRRVDDDCYEQYTRYGRCKHNYRGTN